MSVSGLVAAYGFDEGAGTVANDASGFGNNGTVTGATWSSSGKYGGALSFTGKLGSWVTVNDNPSLDLTTGMTLEAWIKPSSLSSPDNGWVSAVSKEHTNSINDIAYALYAAQGTGTGPSAHILAGSTDYGTSGGAKLTLNTWAFLAATYDGTTIREYVNGKLIASRTVGAPIVPTSDPLRIGGDWSGEMFTGLIDNVRVYNTPLTQSQIQSDMNSPVAAPVVNPAVTSAAPTSGAAAGAAASATFNESVVASSMAFSLVDGAGNPVPGTLAYNDSTYTATYTPSSPLAPSTAYAATVSGATDASGHTMAAPYSWSFTTAAAPTVTGQSPPPGSTVVSPSSPVMATFSQPMQASSVVFTLTGPAGLAVPATLGYNATTRTATLQPSSPLLLETAYTATVSGGTSTAGYGLAAPVTWSFTTDTPPPAVTGEAPAPGSTGVATSATVTATFSEAVQASTITFTLTDVANHAVPATVSYNASTNTATLTTSSPLSGSTTYTATVSGAQDAAGNPMPSPVSWTFTTVDTTPPTVTSESPPPGATEVGVSSTVTATFSEPVQSGTIVFTLTAPSGAAVPASLSYNATSNTATLTPSSSLAATTTYTASVSGAKDNAGNPMPAPVTWTFTTASASPPPTTEPLLYQSNLQYVGAFRVPGGQFGPDSNSVFDYGGASIAYNPAHNSLFIVGHPYGQEVAEIAIPASIVTGTDIKSLSTATVLQPFTPILNRLPNNPPNLSTGGHEDIGGLLVSGGQLIGTAFNTYDASGSVTVSHFKLDSLNLASANVSGLYQVGSLGGGYVGGYMTQVPSEWQSLLGAPALTGQAAINIISRTSYGPAAFGFDPSKLTGGVNPDVPYVYYDSNHTTLGGYSNNPPTLFNGTVGNDGDWSGFGVAFVPGTRSVLFFSAIGTGSFYYGEASAANDPNRTWKGPHSVGGNYVFQVWAYDANDFVAVKNGQKNPWDLKPYSTWNFSFPQPDGQKYVGGVAFDPATGRIYVSELGVDTVDPYSSRPLIQVFQVSTSASAAAPAKSSSTITQPAGQSAVSQPMTSGSTTATSSTLVGVPGRAAPSTLIGAPGSTGQTNWTVMTSAQSQADSTNSVSPLADTLLFPTTAGPRTRYSLWYLTKKRWDGTI
jgi:hypothetical protein